MGAPLIGLTYGACMTKQRVCRFVLIAAACIFAVESVQAQSLDWARRAGGTGFDFGEAVGVDSFGNSYVAGTFTSQATFGSGGGNTVLTSVGGKDMFLAKYDVNGNLLWARGAGGTA